MFFVCCVVYDFALFFIITCISLCTMVGHIFLVFNIFWLIALHLMTVVLYLIVSIVSYEWLFFYLVYLIITHFCFLVMSYSFILLLLFFHYSVLLVALSVVVFFNLLFSLHWCWFCLLFFVTFLGWLYYFMVGFVQNAFHCLLFPCCS